jgi:hypothetical protein
MKNISGERAQVREKGTQLKEIRELPPTLVPELVLETTFGS